MASIALIGYRGTGKSTVGSLLAERLGWRLVDTDRLIESAQGEPIAAIFARGGENLFRACETEALLSLEKENQPLVIGTGGGLPLREENRALLRRLAPNRIVLLTAAPETIARRMTADEKSAQTRPPLTNLSFEEEIRTVLTQRTPVYTALADYTVETEGVSPEEIVQQIIRSLKPLG